MGKPAFIVAGSHSLSVSSPKLKANSLKLPFNSVILKVFRDHIVQFYLLWTVGSDTSCRHTFRHTAMITA